MSFILSQVVSGALHQAPVQTGDDRSSQNDVHAVSAGRSSVFRAIRHGGGLHRGYDEARAEGQRHLQAHRWATLLFFFILFHFFFFFNAFVFFVTVLWDGRQRATTSFVCFAVCSPLSALPSPRGEEYNRGRDWREAIIVKSNFQKVPQSRSIDEISLYLMFHLRANNYKNLVSCSRKIVTLSFNYSRLIESIISNFSIAIKDYVAVT